MHYQCILWQEEGVWTAHNPDIGCFGVGKTRSAAKADLMQAARLMMSWMRGAGRQMPRPRRIEVSPVRF